jgi:regulator of PEP synthase PpsR (kinase-PPPase family)
MDYVSDAAIQAELRYAHRTMADQGWNCIDVSYKAVEEVAIELLRGLA